MMGRDLVQDLRFGARTLLRRPGFTALAVLILGLGIVGPSTVLTLVNQIFFRRPEHVAEPHRLVRLYRSWAPGQGGASLGYADYLDLRDGATTLTGLAAYDPGGTVVTVAHGNASDQARAWYVSADYFEVLGVEAAVGRFFLPEENAVPGTHPVAVLSHGLWERAFASDPDVVGRTLRLNGHVFEIVGVAPEDFVGVSPVEGRPDLWVPIMMRGVLSPSSDTAWYQRLPDSRSNWLMAVGRLAPGITFEAARDNLHAVSDAIEYEGRPEEEGVFVSRQYLYRPSQAELLTTLSWMLLGVVGIVLAIAASNVALLLLSRASTRRRELGIRTAMGAGGGRLARQLLAETLLLGFGGGALGAGLAYLTGGLAASLLPLPVAGDFHPDARVLLLTTALVLLVTLAVGTAPALHAARTDVRAALQDIHGATGRARGRYLLVAAQVALSLVLVSAAGLFARSFQTARSQPLGFQTDGRLIVQAELDNHGYDEDSGTRFIREALDRIASLPGVQSATTTRQVPFQGDWTTEFDPPPGARPNRGDVIHAGADVVAPGYFETMGMPILRGRPLDETDVTGAPRAVVINQTLAGDLWPGEDPLGRTLPLSEEQRFTVVGVVADAQYYQLGEDPYPHLWASVFQAYRPRVNFVVRTDEERGGTLRAVQNAIHEVDPDVAFGWVSSLEQVMDDQLARYEVSAVLVGLFAALALILAAAGLYGVVSFLVARGTPEIGVRMALGARPHRVAARVVGFALRLAALGVGVGLIGAWALSGLTRSLLFGVAPGDPWVFGIASAVLAGTTVLAALLPARRATKVDPMQTIRTE